jgi:uracil phosphoribosyltransferase
VAKGVEIVGLDKVVIVQVLRAAMPFVEGLLKAFPQARLGVVAARRREEGGEIDACRHWTRAFEVSRG